MTTTTDDISWPEVLGRMYTFDAMLSLLGVSTNELNELRRTWAVLGIQTAGGSWLFPARQFKEATDDNVVWIAGLQPVLKALVGTVDSDSSTTISWELSAARWLDTPNRRLHGRKPWDVLHNPHPASWIQLLSAAEAQAEAWGR